MKGIDMWVQKETEKRFKNYNYVGQANFETFYEEGFKSGFLFCREKIVEMVGLMGENNHQLRLLSMLLNAVGEGETDV